jgi:hypothetical protein
VLNALLDRGHPNAAPGGFGDLIARAYPVVTQRNEQILLRRRA